jgi:hypothetical protein
MRHDLARSAPDNLGVHDIILDDDVQGERPAGALDGLADAR